MEYVGYLSLPKILRELNYIVIEVKALVSIYTVLRDVITYPSLNPGTGLFNLC